MAEIRKHNPAAGALGDLVRAAIGDGPRPVEPGSQPVRDQARDSEDPFDVATRPTTQAAPEKVPPAATFVPAGGEWKSVSISALPTVKPSRTRSRDDDDPEFDELDPDDLLDDDLLDDDLDES